MKLSITTLALVGASSAGLLFAANPKDTTPTFQKPVQLHAGGELIQVEAPGYAAPCWHDVDGDGAKDLVVGQFADGKMKVYKNLGTTALGEKGLAKGEWLNAGGEPASVPGVW